MYTVWVYKQKTYSLPEEIIAEIQELAEIYGSQAKVIAFGVLALKKTGLTGYVLKTEEKHERYSNESERSVFRDDRSDDIDVARGRNVTGQPDNHRKLRRNAGNRDVVPQPAPTITTLDAVADPAKPHKISHELPLAREREGAKYLGKPKEKKR